MGEKKNSNIHILESSRIEMDTNKLPDKAYGLFLIASGERQRAGTEEVLCQ